jgi:hypothetical protein
MGAWGEGMRDNDTAEDAVQFILEFTNGQFPDDANAVQMLFSATAGAPEMATANAILGVADYLLEVGADLGHVFQQVEQAIAREQALATADRWDDPRTRVAELARFRARLWASLDLPDPENSRRPT